MEKSKQSKLSKPGYWSKHKFHRISMDEVVTEYCGDDVLNELVEKCEQLPRKVDVEKFEERNKGLIATLFLTGGRIMEVLTLKKNNFDFDEEEAKRNNAFLVRDMDVLKRVRKGKPIALKRTFPIWNDDPLVEYLTDWLDEIDGYLFPTERRSSMSPTYAFKVVREVGKLLDRPLHINTMWFRKQRKFHLIEKRGLSAYDLQAYFKLKYPPKIYRNREDWQNLLASSRLIRQEKVYEKAPYDALRDIQKLFLLSKKEVRIIDPYVDDSIFNLYLDDIHPDINIKLITKNMWKNFKEIAKRFKIQRPNFEVRSVEGIHDRYLIIDDRVWVIGSSLNQAGMKPLYLIELNDKKRIMALFQKLWKGGKREF
jgi:hypothetical protein